MHEVLYGLTLTSLFFSRVKWRDNEIYVLEKPVKERSEQTIFRNIFQTKVFKWLTQTIFIVFPPPLVASKIIVEEISLKSEDNTSSNLVLVTRGGPNVKKKNNGIILRCYKCGKHVHVRYKCPEMPIKEYVKGYQWLPRCGGDDIYQKLRSVSLWNFCAAMEKDEYC